MKLTSISVCLWKHPDWLSIWCTC